MFEVGVQRKMCEVITYKIEIKKRRAKIVR